MSDMYTSQLDPRHALFSNARIYFFRDLPYTGLLIIITLMMSACTQVKQNDHQKVVSSKLKEPIKSATNMSLYVAEVSRTIAPTCEDMVSSTGMELQALYIAKLQGGKSVVKDLCQDPSTRGSLRKTLPIASCQGFECGTYDAYRRGPLWFSLFMATLNAALHKEKVHIYSAQNTQEKINQGSRSTSSQQGVFQLEEQQRVQLQVVNYDMSSQIRCVARLKFFKDVVTQDRIDQLGDRNRRFRFTSPPNAGELWAEHRQRQSGQGYEVLILERRQSDSGGEGELLEREVLCQSDHGPLDSLNGHYKFSIKNIDRDSTRIYAKRAY